MFIYECSVSPSTWLFTVLTHSWDWFGECKGLSTWWWACMRTAPLVLSNCSLVGSASSCKVSSWLWATMEGLTGVLMKEWLSIHRSARLTHFFFLFASGLARVIWKQLCYTLLDFLGPCWLVGQLAFVIFRFFVTQSTSGCLSFKLPLSKLSICL
jgi:hypothetical protein